MDKGLLISIRNVGLKAKNWKTRLQEEANEISLCQFSKMSRWGEITSTPTTLQWEVDLGVDDYRRK